MKILLISGFYPPTHIAGSEKRTFGYALALRELGHEVQVLCAGHFDEGVRHWNGWTDGIYREVPVRRVHLNWQLAPDPGRYLYDNPVTAEYLESWIAEWQPDVAHIISCYTLSASIIEVVKCRGVPLVLTLVDFWFICPRLTLLHGDGSLCDGLTTPWECLRCMLWDAKAYRWSRRLFPECLVKRGLTHISEHPTLSRQRGLRGMALNMEHRKRYLSTALRCPDAVTAPSQALADLMHGAGVRVPVQVIHSGQDLSWLASMPERESSSTLRFGYIGQITPIKGVYELVTAFLKADLGEAAGLHIYGNHRKNSDYTRRIYDLLSEDANAVTFHGPFSTDCLGEVIAQVDVLVVPSNWWENNPRVVQEGLAGGVPVIGSNVSGIAEFVKHNVNGLLFDRGNTRDLARQMCRIVQEPSLLKQLEAGIPAVKTIGDEVSELLAIYEQVLGRRSHA